MIGRGRRKQSVTSERLIMHEWLIITTHQEFAREFFKSHCPIEWLDLVFTPGVGVKVMNNVAASDYQHAFIAQRAPAVFRPDGETPAHAFHRC